jgi:phosphoglycolate phosphatase-like HAD superfamily hydrolase
MVRWNPSYVALVAIALSISATCQDPLPSWNDGAVKKSITDFVGRVTKDGGPDFVRELERVAVFDNDGTLWCEQPMYFQLTFALDRVKAMAPQHPEWKEKEPFKSVLAGDMKAVMAGGEHALLEIIAVTHTGITTDEYEAIVKEWFKTARHPKFQRPYDECVYQPMVELLGYLRNNGFKTFIVSGGGIEFIRTFAERAYGIPPEQVVGSSGIVKFEVRDGKPVLMKLPKVAFIDDGPGKPVGINTHIGRRPVMAFGNSDGDFEMLQWTKAGPGARFAMFVHHDDAAREFAYDRDSHIGKLVRGLDEAEKYGFLICGMKANWKTVFAFEKK